MTPTGHPLTASDDQPRARLLELVGAIEPWDDLERTHLESATQWIAGGAPVYRVRKPDVPAMHLVSYFVVLDHARGQLLLVAHRKAGLWLPAGGHVEPGEDPWAAVVRECREELGIEAVASPITGEHPLFLTVTRTRGQNAHTDVSLWYLLDADARTITSYDQGEFNAIRWLTDEQVLNEPAEMLDPHMHRFTRKLQHARTRRHRGQPARAVRGATRPRHVGD
ncbi:NUDIX hydrolase [Streptomyces sp. Ag109_G2-15]|uniref:NUDIX hydrolase n=1 Tax=Streptomyces sp. Ag109_G2-15 TaxID=1938850 RepID=UPI000BE4852C|nr:NUDIX domain-containing protein [Streptomyces sp. Ag109_G2-15]